MANKFRVMLRKRAVKGWQDLTARNPQGVAEILRFLQTTPELRVPGKVKKLKGKLKGLLQYDVTFSDRIQYWVDKGQSVVWIEYAGSHP